jgi:hypothetical protein
MSVFGFPVRLRFLVLPISVFGFGFGFPREPNRTTVLTEPRPQEKIRKPQPRSQAQITKATCEAAISHSCARPNGPNCKPSGPGVIRSIETPSTSGIPIHASPIVMRTRRRRRRRTPREPTSTAQRTSRHAARAHRRRGTAGGHAAWAGRRNAEEPTTELQPAHRRQAGGRPSGASAAVGRPAGGPAAGLRPA